MDNALKAEVLIESLPYICKFQDQKIVIKYGGHAMVDEEAKSWIAKDVVLLRFVGLNPVIIHGGGPEINKAMEKMGKEPEFIHGLRVTDEETLDIVKMVLIGKINGDIVSKLGKYGGKAVGLSGKSGHLISARKKIQYIIKEDEKIEVDLGRVGEVDSINTELIDILLEKKYIPVISPIGIDSQANTYNLNADIAAGDIAGAINAKKLIMITDVDGVMDDINDPSTIYKKLTISQVGEMIDKGIISGGMIPKIEACVNALRKGVDSVHIINGKIPHSVLLEVFTEEGIGTMITRD
ncbi:acetylglutamate kinase [Methanococcus aeolicus]|uniref:Acetylglutamate kinase n=1 Tax=Methanococcus aeolicus (strain ATCC BAA-1280 / DSM 17508 / OCM 812 / Nankai-3) TaxID=419665 RepID=ARGB_META3|nr:acetylglutamate kinase [Methanococcus aeolicus]A6UT97.1 RecName: Full=Acetylglutamate kinase; AltName: Full=N-acetyl-L-glutamate 5-phosphotransferase; AltName: Full=NAG kinase; Short=NAGK [Methanococcus aeolicus Nankai-3]ABR55719.1 acetylglutamate kinase [Methanococcus aeolicus Nankai-3]UXM85213.1 acetylglutamate kinase [Methanococcus aeolicus]